MVIPAAAGLRANPRPRCLLQMRTICTQPGQLTTRLAVSRYGALPKRIRPGGADAALPSCANSKPHSVQPGEEKNCRCTGPSPLSMNLYGPEISFSMDRRSFLLASIGKAYNGLAAYIRIPPWRIRPENGALLKEHCPVNLRTPTSGWLHALHRRAFGDFLRTGRVGRGRHERETFGSWRLISFQLKVVGEEAEPKDIFGPNPIGRIIFIPEHRVVVFISRAGRRPPTSESEAAALLSSMTAYTGKFRLDGTSSLRRSMEPWNEFYKGSEQVRCLN